MVFVIAALGIVSTTLDVYATDALGPNAGAVSAALSQSFFPVGMMLTWLFLKRTFTRMQVVGALLLVVGLILSSVTEFGRYEGQVGAEVLYAVRSLPLAVAKIVKEFLFGMLGVSVVQFSVWELFIQVPLGLAGTSVIDVVENGPDKLVCHFRAMGLCLAGREVADGCVAEVDDDCASSPWMTTAYCITTLLAFMFSQLMLRFTRAEVVLLIGSLIVPLNDIILSQASFIPAADRAIMDVWDWAGAATISLGIIMYSLFPPKGESPPSLL